MPAYFFTQQLTIMKKIFKILGVIVMLVILGILGVMAYVKFALPNTDPVRDLKVEATPERIQRGEYLANHVTVCIDCHSNRDWNVYSAPPIAGTTGKGGDVFDRRAGFPGVFYAKNITPAGIGKLSDGELFRSITTGMMHDGSAMFPVMPFMHYGTMDEEDIKSIIAYIRTLAPIENTIPQREVDFPFNFIINTLPQKANFSKKPSETDIVKYGGYLVNAASCFDCHTKFDQGKYDEANAFGGGRTFNLPAGILSSANITPDEETGIGHWTKQAFIDKFRYYRDSANMHRKVDIMKEMNSVMPWIMYAGMKDEDLGAIYEYLRTIKPVKNNVIKWQPTARKT
jgi:mono/diheme cytochrome c family protein